MDRELSTEQEIADIMLAHGFVWNSPPEHPTLIELLDAAGSLLGWITTRPPYCDRGHYQVNVDVANLDAQDGFPRYFMRLSTAKQELIEFLAWRIYKRRAS